MGFVSSFAAGWPMFSLPDEQFLLSRNYIDTRSCPSGQGRVRDNMVIEMKSLCGRFCPQSWAWVTGSDGECREVGRDFVLQRHEIYHHPDDEDNDDGTVLYSVVTAFYGRKGEEEHSLVLVFTTPKEHWFCVRENQEGDVITCANDM